VVVAVGLPPVPPTTVVVAVGQPPVPPTTVVVAPVDPAPTLIRSGRVSDRPQAVIGARRSVVVAADAIAEMVATVESAVALIDSRL
jgi:hypothetical protein